MNIRFFGVHRSGVWGPARAGRVSGLRGRWWRAWGVQGRRHEGVPAKRQAGDEQIHGPLSACPRVINVHGRTRPIDFDTDAGLMPDPRGRADDEDIALIGLAEPVAAHRRLP